LNPNFPVVEGNYQLTHDWGLELPEKFNKRIEDGSLVLWRPGLTIWINVWGNDRGTTKQERLQRIKADISSKAFQIEERVTGNPLSYLYRLKEEEAQGQVAALYCDAVGERGHVQMAIYMDREADAAEARNIAHSIQETAEP
jgi:hypothetical protein